MSQEAVGRRYARAIFELAKETGQGAAVAEQLARFAEVYEGSEELRLTLDNPMVDDKAREAIIGEVAARVTDGAAADLVRRSLKLIAQNRRERAVTAIARALRTLVDESDKIVRAKVTSAGPLSDTYLGQLKSEVERATGGKVIITHEVDPSLIAGVVTQIGDRVVDGSLRTRLRTFREAAQVTS